MDSVIMINLSPDELTELIAGILQNELQNISHGTNTVGSKPVTGKELCDYLHISEPTLIRYRNKGKIPCLVVGDQYRYNIEQVVKALEVNSKKK